ncbi:hypothetical protein GHU01_04200 [Proteus mirabilis]|nr:hypothetical protein [Proteus mirabilis]
MVFDTLVKLYNDKK